MVSKLNLRITADCSERSRNRCAPGFPKACHSRLPSHPLQAQAPLEKSRTCFEGPFGELLRATGPMAGANPFRFSTKYQDDETGLVYYGYRYYNAGTGRWLSRDPIGERGGANLYCCLKNAPVNHADALGHCPCQILKPLTIRLATPRQLGYFADSGWTDKAIWDGERSRIWFKMEATFANKCCQFRQRARSTCLRWGAAGGGFRLG